MFQHFYNRLIQKYAVVFGTMFNNITIKRRTQTGTEYETIKVPLTYSEKEKFLARLQGDPNLDRPAAIQLPVMSYDYQAPSFSSQRQLPRTNQWVGVSSAGESTRLWSPTPYDIPFELSIYAGSADDAHQIIEQILPYFTPQWVNTVMLLDDDPEFKFDVPLLLESVSKDVTYEGSFEDRKTHIWTLNFRMKAWFFAKQNKQKVIRFVTVDIAPSMDEPMETRERITIQPGLTSTGEPTTDILLSVPKENIESTDDWGYIINQYLTTEEP